MIDTLRVAELTIQDEFSLWLGRIMLAAIGFIIVYIGKNLFDAISDWISRINSMLDRFEKASISFTHHKDLLHGKIAILENVSSARHESVKGKIVKQTQKIEEMSKALHECEKKITTLFELHNQIHNSNHCK